VRSVIDVHLWNRAGWHGAAFLGFHPGLPPELALLFTDREAAGKIFSHWRERFGGEDRAEEIYLAIIRGISLQNPAHYRVFITLKPPILGRVARAYGLRLGNGKPCFSVPPGAGGCLRNPYAKSITSRPGAIRFVASTVENPRVGGSIPSPATIKSKA
jgi:hypothetical protein